MSTLPMSLEAEAGDLRRNALLRLLGWQALVVQQDPPTGDRFRWVCRQLHVGPGRVLDAGCGSGAFTMFAAVQGNEALGVSFDETANRTATVRAALLGVEGVTFRSADLRQLAALAPELGRFDQILCLETIEHLLDDAGLLRNLVALLRPGGRLLLSSPARAHRPLIGEVLSTTEDGGHVRWGYSFARLRELFRDAGLETESEEFLSGFVCQKITNVSRRAGDLIGARGAWAITLPLRLLLPLDRVLTRWLRYPWLAVAVVGVKR